MNPYTTIGQARIQPRDIENIEYGNSYLAGGSIAALERQREAQADAEVTWIARQHNDASHATAPLVAVLRQRIGTALIRAGEGLAGTSIPVTAPQRAS